MDFTAKALEMLVLGIDPGTRNLGWGLVRSVGNRLEHVAHGVLRVNESLSLASRLVQLEAGLVAILSEHQPAAGSVESLFFHKDAQAASKLGHARGVVLLVLERAGIALAEYAPARVKQTVTGGGRAEKTQVAHMIKMLLNLRELPPADAADALALAVTHLRRAPIDARLGERQLPALLAKQLPRKPKRALTSRGTVKPSAKAKPSAASKPSSTSRAARVGPRAS